MLKKLLSLLCFFTLSCSLSAGVKTVNWNALENEACILEHTIPDCESAVQPDKELSNKDPKTKMPEAGFFQIHTPAGRLDFLNVNLINPFFKIINGFSGYINLANAP